MKRTYKSVHYHKTPWYDDKCNGKFMEKMDPARKYFPHDFMERLRPSDNYFEFRAKRYAMHRMQLCNFRIWIKDICNNIMIG